VPTTFVLIPGAGGNAEYWSYLVPELEERGYSAIAVDIQEDDPALGLAEYAEIVEQAIGGRRDVVLVAQSLAGFTAPLVARRVPVAMIVLLNAMIPLPGETPGDWWDNTGSQDARRAADEAAGRSGEFDLEAHFLHDLSPETKAALLASSPREPANTVFEQPCDFERWPDVPTKVLVASNDRFFPADFQRRVARDRLGLDVDLIPGGHLVALSNPSGLADRLVRYVSRAVTRNPDPCETRRSQGSESDGPGHTVQVKRVALIGATGSIGRQAIEIIHAHPGLELVAAVSGTTPIDGLAPLTQVGGNPTDLLERAEPDVVLNAVVGFAGLPVTLWALERGVDLALANKESLVAAGELALAARARGGGRLLPVDSEHSAAFQCLEGREPEQVDSLAITASGGPFRGRTREDLADVTIEEALAHPTWSMGPKITIDSATLANKGLELIEAHFLFGLRYEHIEVVIHPTSVVHALVRFRDGATLAHLGYPDMRVPISYALTYPERAATPVPSLDLAGGLSLEFHAPDLETFPLLGLARRAGKLGGTYPCAFNAANEVAVAAFLEGRLPFLGIADAVEETLDSVDGAPARDLADLVEADEQARGLTERKATPA
jgi:1-deoxy-D-xylulose-5-phosphate reductoisomerase